MKTLYFFTPLLLMGCVANETKQPNIIVIVADDAGYNDFGFMGSKDIETPQIDQLAAQSTIFTDAHVAATVSSPSRAMMITGRYGQRFGYECNTGGNHEGLPTGINILPMTLKKAGYATACIGKWHLGESSDQHPNAKGYDTFYGLIGGSRPYFYDAKSCDKKENTQHYQYNGSPLKFEGYFTDELADRAVDYINHIGDQPFFMDLCFTAPHSPNQGAPQDMKRFEGHPRQTLAAMMYGLDRGVGKVMQALKATGKLDNTLIVFLSDNGGSTMNHSCNFPLKGFKGNKFEGGHRVPFLVAWGNRFKSEQSFTGLTSSLDIFPTVLDAAKIAPTSVGHTLDGVSLLPYLKGEKMGNPHEMLFWRKMHTRAIRQGDYKLIMTEGVDTVLYNLKDELGELTDLSTLLPVKRKVMESTFATFEKAHFIAPTWVEEGWGPITDGIHELLMHNKIVNQEDYHKVMRNRRKRLKKAK